MVLAAAPSTRWRRGASVALRCGPRTRTGVCHLCETGLVDGEINYAPEPLDDRAPAQVLHAIAVVLPRRCHDDLVCSFYMERLPCSDEHPTCIAATPERAWVALMAVGAERRGDATGPVARLTRVHPALASGDSSGGLEAGARFPAFVVERACPPSRLALTGRHRFSRYRALVIETGAHRMVVRRLLRRIERRACSD